MSPTSAPFDALERARIAALNGRVEELHLELSDGLATNPSPVERGALHLSRALLTQNAADSRPAAADAIAAWEILRRTDEHGHAAYAAAAAAGLLHRCGRIADAVDLAVESMRLLDRPDIAPYTSVRIANALSVVFGQLSSFDIAIELSERAFRSLVAIDPGPAGEITCFTLMYLTVDGTHKAERPPERWLELARSAAEWINDNAVTTLGRELFGHGMQVEFALLDDDRDGLAVLVGDDDGSDAPTYAETAGRLITWHRFVRAVALSRLGRHEVALGLLDLAIPAMTISDDRPRLARAMESRSRVRAALGDVDGALADALELARTVQRWQVDQMGRLASQISRRAELERTQELLNERAEQLEREASTDVVTGCATRRELERYLDRIERCDGDGAVVVFDLDRFKSVNDRFGHRVGDLVLRRFGALLRATIGPDDHAARYGGEEFVVVLPDADTVTAQAYAERVRARLEGETWDDAAGLSVTSSAGAAVGPMTEARALVHRADAALYDAKRTGRDRVVIAPRGASAPVS